MTGKYVPEHPQSQRQDSFSLVRAYGYVIHPWCLDTNATGDGQAARGHSGRICVFPKLAHHRWGSVCSRNQPAPETDGTWYGR